MARIKEIKMQLRHQEWADMAKECQSSGKSIEEWCRQNGIKVCTYYKRLQALRTELIEETEKQTIVPVSINGALCKDSAPYPVLSEQNRSSNVIIRKNGIEIELPQNISEDTVLALLRGLSQC